jgi:hypothetical protein
MPDYTDNYELRKPAYTDPVNVVIDHNANMDKIDKYTNAIVGIAADTAEAPNGQLFIENGGSRLVYIKVDGTLIPIAPVIKPLGRVSTVTSITSPSANANATEILSGLSVTFNALAGKRYIFNFIASIQYNTGDPMSPDASAVLRFRWANGASITTSSTLLATMNANISGLLGKERVFNKFIEFFPNVNAQVTIGMTIQGSASKGVRVNANGSTKIAQAYVRDYGG